MTESEVQITYYGRTVALDVEMAAKIVATSRVLARHSAGSFVLIQNEDEPGVGFTIGAGIPLLVEMDDEDVTVRFQERLTSLVPVFEAAYPEQPAGMWDEG